MMRNSGAFAALASSSSSAFRSVKLPVHRRLLRPCCSWHPMPPAISPCRISWWTAAPRWGRNDLETSFNARGAERHQPEYDGGAPWHRLYPPRGRYAGSRDAGGCPHPPAVWPAAWSRLGGAGGNAGLDGRVSDDP